MMNLAAAILKIMPLATSCSNVDRIVAAVTKTPELIEAENELAETAAAQIDVTKRLAEIFERLNFGSPLRVPLFKEEQERLEAERGGLNQKVADLAARARDLQSEIARLMPDYARSVAGALAGFRRSAADQLLDSVSAAEEALDDIRRSNQALTAVGTAPPQAFALPYAAALRDLAEKILKEANLD